MKRPVCRIVHEAPAIFVIFPDENEEGEQVWQNVTMEAIEAVRDYFLAKLIPGKKMSGYQWSCPDGSIVCLAVSVENRYSETKTNEKE